VTEIFDEEGVATAEGYVLVTPARNEAALIEGTIASVVGQTLRPLKWVIVSDGSTDGTDEIVQRYAAAHDWIELVRLPEHRERNFAAKVGALNAGFERVKALNYLAVGALDADITFDREYFAFLMDKLKGNPRLGLVGTPFAEEGVTYDYRFASLEHVSGACQVFRRQCFEDIGGYRPLKGGGIDLIAVLSSRMKGWEVRTFPEKVSHHHRKQGTATRGGLSVLYSDGRKDYVLGADPIWQILRAINRLRTPPYVVGGLALMAGYMSGALRRIPKTAPSDVVAFRRRDQRERLHGLIRRLAGVRASRPSTSPRLDDLSVPVRKRS
jgi:glycosyltransferase involved in cell wall biosynthesis